jgi:hypothetical protein
MNENGFSTEASIPDVGVGKHEIRNTNQCQSNDDDNDAKPLLTGNWFS